MLSNSTQVDLADFNKPRCVIKGIAWRWVSRQQAIEEITGPCHLPIALDFKY